MAKSYNLSIVVFRRDLRIHDNTAFNRAAKESNSVLPCFIFDKRQIENNDYRSDNAVEFMVHSLITLSDDIKAKQGKLYFFHGIAEKIIAKLCNNYEVDALYVNRDYTPFSIARDKEIATVCKKYNIRFISCSDVLLTEPETVKKNDGKPYTVFTPFFRKASTFDVSEPRRLVTTRFLHTNIEFADDRYVEKLLRASNPNLATKGGRKEALSLLKKISKLRNYQQEKNYPAKTCSTKLSAHIKFGTISIREIYHEIKQQFGKNHALIMELYWRDFFTHILFHFPYVLQKSFHAKYHKLKWSKDMNAFRRWSEGRTGFPIIDAGMRELNTTGYMNNRVRMLTASFLVKDLHLNWQWGEKYFARKLVDYDPAVNNGNWQWVASTGCDAAPYFRIFNPWTQQKLYDPDCLYIKKWILELARTPNKMIHEWYRYAETAMTNYPAPICDHTAQANIAKLMYQRK